MAFQLKNSDWVLETPRGDIKFMDLVRNRSRAFYLYDLDDALHRARLFMKSGLGVHYAMKANSHPRLLAEFAKLGMGADVTSLGELQRALDSGFKPQKVVFSGVGKDREELEFALVRKILQINVESFEELQLIGEICNELQIEASIALRLNIHLTAPTHEYVQTANRNSKFGLEVRQLPEAVIWLKAHPRVKLKALAVHIGSQIEDISVFAEMGRQIGEIYRSLRGQKFTDLQRLDLGGGLGLDYSANGEADFNLLSDYLKVLKGSHGTDAEIILEPGRFLVARMGALLCKVVYVKSTEDQDFVILNTGMNSLIRPALYQSFHRIEPVSSNPSAALKKYTVVGPICESADTFTEGLMMKPLKRGDWVAILDAGAYGAVMASRYNENPWPEEWSVLNGEVEVR